MCRKFLGVLAYNSSSGIHYCLSLSQRHRYISLHKLTRVAPSNILRNKSPLPSQTDSSFNNYYQCRDRSYNYGLCAKFKVKLLYKY